MFELDPRFRDGLPHTKEKVNLISAIFNVPESDVRKLCISLSNTQMTETRIWDCIFDKFKTDYERRKS